MSEKMKKGPTGRYALLQAGYFMDCLVITNFAALFLAGRNFTTGQIGCLPMIRWQFHDQIARKPLISIMGRNGVQF